MAILHGFYSMDSGTILVQGKPVRIRDSADAARLGIEMVHQHFMLVEPFTVLENVMLGAEGGALLARVESTADRWLDDDLIDIDTHRSGGLLELSFPGGSKIIINTQPPLQEVWLAARGGGFHYRFIDGAWRDTRDGSEFFGVLSQHASTQGGKPLQF